MPACSWPSVQRAAYREHRTPKSPITVTDSLVSYRTALCVAVVQQATALAHPFLSCEQAFHCHSNGRSPVRQYRQPSAGMPTEPCLLRHSHFIDYLDGSDSGAVCDATSGAIARTRRRNGPQAFVVTLHRRIGRCFASGEAVCQVSGWSTGRT